jgi:hypothetical protein
VLTRIALISPFWMLLVAIPVRKQATEMVSPAPTVTASVTGIGTLGNAARGLTVMGDALPPTMWQLTVLSRPTLASRLAATWYVPAVGTVTLSTG